MATQTSEVDQEHGLLLTTRDKASYGGVYAWRIGCAVTGRSMMEGEGFNSIADAQKAMAKNVHRYRT